MGDRGRQETTGWVQKTLERRKREIRERERERERENEKGRKCSK